MKNVIKWLRMQRGIAYESQEDKTLKGDEGRRTGGGWRSICMSRWRRNKGERKDYARGIRRRMDSGGL